MLIYSNNWPLQEQSYKIFPIFALTKTNRPMYTKTESKNEKMCRAILVISRHTLGETDTSPYCIYFDVFHISSSAAFR